MKLAMIIPATAVDAIKTPNHIKNPLRVELTLKNIRVFGQRANKRFTVLRPALATTLLLVATIGCARDLAIVGASVYASPDAARLADATIVVRDGRIERVGPVRDVPIPDGMPMIDGRGTRSSPASGTATSTCSGQTSSMQHRSRRRRWKPRCNGC